MESVLYRRDGSLISGLTSLEWETYLKNYSKVSEQELTDIRDTMETTVFDKYSDTPVFDKYSGTPVFDKYSFENRAEELNFEKGFENSSGLPATLAMPLFMLLSVRVKPRGGEKKPFSVYGGITCNRSFIYNREYFYKTDINNAEEFGCDGGYLTLNGPPRLCMSEDACHLHASRKLSIELSDKSGGILAAGCIDLFCSQNEFEEVKDSEVKDSVVDMGKLSLHLKYVSIPMAIYGRLEFGIFNKPFLRRVNLREYVNVCGKVVATYKNTFGDYKSQEIVVFEKNSDEYETVVIDSSSNLLFPGRCWVAVPAYSLLHLHIELFEYRTNKTILKEDVELETHDAYGFSKKLVGPEFVIIVSASWFPAIPLGEPEDADDSGQGESKDGGEGDGVQISFIRALEVEGPRFRNFGGFEIFSVLICYKGCMTLKIHGHLLLSASSKIVIFKKDEEDALSLSGKGNTIPVLGGSRLYDDAFPFALSCDLKDTLGNLRIKGYERWRSGELFSGGQKLCSVFRGDNGFAAMHYAIFRYAAQANSKVFYTENGLKSVGLPVFGSFYVRYNNFDYSSYDKNCYRVVLFKRIGKEDSVPVDANGLTPLSRSSVVVSQYSSSYVFDLHFVIGARKFSGIGNLKFGTSSISIKVDECEVKIDLEWSEVK